MIKQQLNVINSMEKSHPKRRSIADRLHKLMEDEHLSQDIFPLTMSIFDRFIHRNSSSKINDRSLQLVALCSYSLAKKLRESSAINNENEKIFWIVERENYCETEIFETEQKIVESLDWDLSCSLPHDFIERFLKFVRNKNDRAKIRVHVEILLALIISEFNTLTIRPSLLTGACFKVAMKGLRVQSSSTFDEHLIKTIGCQQNELNNYQIFIEQLFQIYVKEIVRSPQRRCLAPIGTTQQQNRTKVN